MSRALPRSGLIGLGAGLAAAGAGAAIGLVAERLVVGRADEQPSRATAPFGSIRGTAHVVTADDGTPLHTEIDEVDPDHPEAHPDVTVVFSHGFCLNLDSWHFQREALRGRFRMVFWDQRGHGRSGLGPPGSCTVDQCGHDLRRVLEDLVPEGPVVLVGHSLGGMTVMAFSGEHPDVVRYQVVGAALIATSSGGLDQNHWGWGELVGKVAHRIAPGAIATLARRPGLVDRGRRIGSDLEQLLVRRYSYASKVSPAVVRFSAEMIAATPVGVVAEFLPTFDVHDKAEALAALNGIEVLVVAGDKDLLTPADHSDAIVDRLPHAEHVVVQDAGHLVMLEHPDVVTAHVLELVTRAVRAHPERGHHAGDEPRGSAAGRAAARARSAGSAEDESGRSARGRLAGVTSLARTRARRRRGGAA